MTPLALWTHVLLKSGEAMLDSMQRVVRKARPTKVGVIPTPDAPPPALHNPARKPAAARMSKGRSKAKAKGKARRR